MDTSHLQETLSNALDVVLGAVAMAFATVVGGVINAWVTRRKQRDKDLLAAVAKIRATQERLGMPPEDLETMDDVFCALRRINALLDKNEKDKGAS